jgi:hypothetical protein
MPRLAQLRELDWPRRRLFLLALAMLPTTALRLRLFGFRRTHAALAAPGRTAAAADDSAASRARSTARLVAAAARYGPYRASCLPIALTLRWLLGRQGIESELRLGVNKTGGRLAAHAWVEHRGRPLIEDADVHRRYAAFAQPVPAAGKEPR